MLNLSTCVSLLFLIPSVPQSGTCACDTARTSQQDTIKNTGVTFPRGNRLFGEESHRRGTSPRFRLFGPPAHDIPLVEPIDSLLRTKPVLKRGFLRQLIVPSMPMVRYEFAPPVQPINALLLQEGLIAPFERMGLIAKHFLIYRSPMHAWNKDQLDLMATLLWLQEVLK